MALWTGIHATAQTGGHDFTKIDAYVKSLGPLTNMSMGTINNVVSNKFTDKIEKARAIYYWVAHHVAYDVKALRNSNQAKITPAEVLKSRKTTSQGFAALFQDMCSSADIRCLTVDGFIKRTAQQIGEKADEVNHTWVVVQLGQSPEEWYYADPALGSGNLSADNKEFIPDYSDAYFFTEKATFNLQHYPDNTAWKLGSAPKNKTDFFDLPVIKTAAMELEIKKCSPNDGKVKGKAEKPLKFSFTVKNADNITKVELGLGDKKRYKQEQIEFSNAGSALSFNYTFKQPYSGPLVIVVNGKEFAQYYLDVE